MSFYIVPQILKDTKNVVLYGSGIEAMGMIEQCRSFGKNNIVAIIDSSCQWTDILSIPVYDGNWLNNTTFFDYIVITNDISGIVTDRI